jgi:hypothetical protein
MSGRSKKAKGPGSLERILEQNYRKIRDKDLEDRIFREVIERDYYARDAVFLKRLTKVGIRLARRKLNSQEKLSVEAASCIDEVLEKLYGLSMLGAAKSRNPGFCMKNYISMEAHFRSWASNAAEMIFDITREPQWAQRAYRDAVQAAEAIHDHDKVHYAACLLDASTIAQKIYSYYRDISWLKEAFLRRRESAASIIDSNPRFSSSRFAQAADIAAYLHDLTQRHEWAEESKECYKASADLHKKRASTAANALYRKAAEMSIKAWKTSKRLSYIEQAYGFNICSAKYGKPDARSVSYSAAAENASKAYSLSGGIEWAYRWHRAAKRSASLSKNRTMRAHMMGVAGTAASMIYEQTKGAEKQRWLDEAAICLNVQRSYYSSGKGELAAAFAAGISRKIAALQSAKPIPSELRYTPAG